MRSFGIAASLAFAAVSALVEHPAMAQASADEPRVTTNEEWKIHAVGLRFEVGGDRFSYGVFYGHFWASSSVTDGLGFVGMGGVGLGVRLVTTSHRDIDAILIGPIGRFAGMGDAGGGAGDLAIDLSLGPNETVLVGSTGLYFSFVYADAGYTYQFPLPGFGRPSWLAGSQFGARATIPAYTHDHHVTRTVE